jgi:hypothetical protein
MWRKKTTASASLEEPGQMRWEPTRP